MPDTLDPKALEAAAIAACEAGHHAWPETDGYNDRAEKHAFREIAQAAITAYLTALPADGLAWRLAKSAEFRWLESLAADLRAAAALLQTKQGD